MPADRSTPSPDSSPDSSPASTPSPDSDPSASVSRRGWLTFGQFLVTWLFTGLCAVGLAVAVQAPQTSGRWVLVVVSALGIAFLSTTGSEEAVRAVRAWLRGRGGEGAWSRLPWWMVVVLTLPVAVPVTVGIMSVRDRIGGCGPSPHMVAAVSSVDLAETVSSLARRFERETAVDGCPVALVHVSAAGRSTTRDALSQNWNENAYQAIGARPDLWIGDPIDLAAGGTRMPAPVTAAATGAEVIAHSPVVFASPGPAASAAPAPLSWRDVGESLRNQGRALFRPEPGISTVGDLAVLQDYGDREPGAVVTAADRQYEQAYAAAFAGVRWRRADVATLLRDARTTLCPPSGTGRRPVLVLPEFLLHEHSSLAAGTTGCPASDWPAWSVTGTTEQVDLQLAVARLRWPNDPTAETAGTMADRFRAWLTGNAGRRAVDDLGWEPGPAAAAHTPDASRVRAGVQVYEQARNRARVVIAVDTSLSMLARWPDVVAAVTAMLDQLSRHDRVELIGFVRDGAGTDQVEPVIPWQAARETVGAVAGRWLAARRLTDGDTPLPEVIVRAGRDLAAHPRETTDRDTVVVLTDGQDLTADAAWGTVDQQVIQNRQHVVVVTLGTEHTLLRTSPGTTRFHDVRIAGSDVGQQVLRETRALLWRAHA